MARSLKEEELTGHWGVSTSSAVFGKGNALTKAEFRETASDHMNAINICITNVCEGFFLILVWPQEIEEHNITQAKL